MPSSLPQVLGAKLGQMEPGDELFHYQWNQLAEGDEVVVQRENQPPLSGQVDVVADDGSIFWIWINNGNGRIAVYGGHETRVWLPEIRQFYESTSNSLGASH